MKAKRFAPREEQPKAAKITLHRVAIANKSKARNEELRNEQIIGQRERNEEGNL